MSTKKIVEVIEGSEEEFRIVVSQDIKLLMEDIKEHQKQVDKNLTAINEMLKEITKDNNKKAALRSK